jgi:hypothetical protein
MVIGSGHGSLLRYKTSVMPGIGAGVGSKE